MKISELIAELERIKDQFGNIEAYLQEAKSDKIILYGTIFIVPEEYEADDEDDGEMETVCNIRSWPY